MRIPSLLSIGLLVCIEAQALQTVDLDPSHLKQLGTGLANSAGNSQWQQLWQRSRQAGHLGSPETQEAFTVTMREIPPLVRATLTSADSAQGLKKTQALYRRDFAPQVVGARGDTPLTAICLWVDWRSFPDNALPRQTALMAQVNLLITHPCD
ncbi:hypothetical protein GCM10009504_37240 [Pseudomonas laurentiana]|uniref:Uncharacterized protein n=1 Tax=Pseudomonas laurentiana TaxID=2364649 RepID=A0A6I5RM81_9PSED|nr:hypothetical protein [Pseudomonas laurentiana]NES08829.1 hypothetical protein [Pseudomonas laurentiana]GGU76681.1 hypothetical protein GCM10009504_37240 [Pseudomonas laurentiana]